MQKLSIGCGPIPTQKRGYFERFTALDMTESWYQPVGTRALQELRAEVGEECALFLHSWRWLSLDPLDEKSLPPNGLPKNEVGMLQPTEANRELWKEVQRQVEALKADGLVIRTPASLTPSLKNRANIKAFNAEIVGEVDYKIYWEPRGFWELDEIHEFAAELGWIPVVDPFVEFKLPEPEGKDAFYVLHHPRGRRHFDRDDCEELLDLFEEHEGDVVVIFRGPEREKNANRMMLSAKGRLGE